MNIKNYKCEDCLKEYYKKREFLDHKKNCGELRCSSMERTVIDILEKHNIKYEFDSNYDNLTGDSGHRLRWDFILYVENKILFIETDGRQHYEPVNFGGCSDEKALIKFDKIKENDKIKNEYVKENNIPLLRISYESHKNKYNILIKKFILDNLLKVK